MSLSKPSKGHSASDSPIQQQWKAYLVQLEKNPVKTKALTAAVLSIVSDLIAQFMTGKRVSTLDWTSIRNQALIGLVIRGPLIHYWYNLMTRIFEKLGYNAKAQANSNAVAVGKVALDQLTFGPVFNLLYFYVIGMLENRSLAAINDKVSVEYKPLMMANYKVWPLINLINFKFVPAEMQVLFGNSISILWMVFVITSLRN